MAYQQLLKNYWTHLKAQLRFRDQGRKPQRAEFAGPEGGNGSPNRTPKLWSVLKNEKISTEKSLVFFPINYI